MSQMATPGVYYSQKRDCGLQNIDQKYCKKLRKYSIILDLYGQILVSQ